MYLNRDFRISMIIKSSNLNEIKIGEYNSYAKDYSSGRDRSSSRQLTKQYISDQSRQTADKKRLRTIKECNSDTDEDEFDERVPYTSKQRERAVSGNGPDTNQTKRNKTCTCRCITSRESPSWPSPVKRRLMMLTNKNYTRKYSHKSSSAVMNTPKTTA